MSMNQTIAQPQSNTITLAQLNALYQAEDALAIVHPARNELYEKTELKNRAISAKDKIASNVMRQITGIIVGFLIAIPSIIWFLSTDVGLLKVFAGAFAISGLITAVPQLFAFLKGIKDSKSLSESITKCDQLIKSQEDELNELCTTYAKELSYIDTLATAECNDPYYLRLYLYFFETQRASSIGEARRLLDEHLHRERMVNLAAEQIAASHAAEMAAMEATRAANQATQEAQAAKQSADRAYYSNLFK